MTVQTRVRRSRVPLVLALAWLAAVELRAPLLAIGPVLPLIIQDLALSSTVAGSLTGLPLLLMAVFSLPGGLLADRIGPRRVLVGTQLAISVACAIRGLAPDVAAMLLGSVLLGAAIGLAQPALAQIARFVLPQRPGLATAVYANGLMLGALAATALSVPVLLPLAGSASWRGVLVYWGVPATVAALGWALMSLPEHRREPSSLLDVGELRRVLAIRGLGPLGVAFGSQGAIFYTVSTWLPEYYVAQGWALQDASTLLAVLSVGSIVTGLIAPATVARWGGLRRAFVIAGVITLIGEVGIALVPSWGVVWALTLGVGTTFAFVFGLAAPAELAPQHLVGTTAGVLLTVGYVGALLGPVGFGVLRDLGGGFDLSMAYLVALGLVLTLASAAVPRGEGGR